MTIDYIQEEKDIILEAKFRLKKANPKEFAIHYTTYRENIWFRRTWDERLSVIDNTTPCYWIFHIEQRIGGVSLEPNTMGAFFLEPPFVDVFIVLQKLRKFLLEFSDPSKPIQAYGILPSQSQHFLRLGFIPTETRRVMIRPTEVFNDIEWNGFEIKHPEPSNSEEIAKLLYHCYLGIDSIGSANINTVETKRNDIEFYFSNNHNDILLNASHLVYEKSTSLLVGVCLISLWEGLPLVYDISVLPEYRGKLIATNLLREALTSLAEHYDVVRLFVTQSNPAESLYYNLGFYPGIEQTTFTYQQRRINLITE